MPIEIRELVIRVVIEKEASSDNLNSQVLQQLKNEIVQECTTKIIQKINKNKER